MPHDTQELKKIKVHRLTEEAVKRVPGLHNGAAEVKEIFILEAHAPNARVLRELEKFKPSSL